jgi:peptide/nickel transport system substrate-binding protein
MPDRGKAATTGIDAAADRPSPIPGSAQLRRYSRRRPADSAWMPARDLSAMYARIRIRHALPLPVMRVLAAAIAVALASPAAPAIAEDTHAIAMLGRPALPAGFTHLPHVEPKAPKGGRITLGFEGRFEHLNAFIPRGSAAHGVRDYIYESLLARNPGEPFSLYGLIAESVATPADRNSVTFQLRREARFSDGRPVTPADVLFSMTVLRDRGLPFHRSFYKKVTRAEVVAPNGVMFVFDGAGDREMPLIMGLMPILPAHRLTPETFDRATLDPPVGSGPYVVAEVDQGRRILFRRNPEHWARDHPIYRGRHNFDEIRHEYARDATSLLEAFKLGDIDVRFEDQPANWAQSYTFAAAQDGRVKRAEIEVRTPAGLSGLVLNTRRPQLGDIRVRKALALTLDAAWINRNLFHGLYARAPSLFTGSELSALGQPADLREANLLQPFSGDMDRDVMAGRPAVPDPSRAGGQRENLRAATALLTDAGFRIDNGRMIDASGAALSLELLAASRAQERLMLIYAGMLDTIGIRATVRLSEESEYWRRVKRFDFDVIQWTWPSSLSASIAASSSSRVTARSVISAVENRKSTTLSS